METLKTRFNNLRYEHFKIEFKGLIFEVKLLDDTAIFPNSDNKDLCEEFKVIVKNGIREINYKFYNSIMERQISKILKEYNKNLQWTQIKLILKQGPLKMWAGYEKDLRNNKTLEYARIEHLIYSIINSFAIDGLNDLTNFKDFCDNFGYDEDSRKAEKVYNLCLELQQKIISLWMSQEQIAYLNDEANQESELFQKDIKKAIEKANKI